MQCNVKIGRFLVRCGTDRYLSHNGMMTYSLGRAACFETREDAEDEREWFAAHYPAHIWTVDAVPKGFADEKETV